MDNKQIAIILLSLIVLASGCVENSPEEDGGEDNKPTEDNIKNSTNDNTSDANEVDKEQTLTDSQKNLRNSNIVSEAPNKSKIVPISSFNFNETIIKRENDVLALHNSLNKSVEVEISAQEPQKIYPEQYFIVNTSENSMYRVNSKWSLEKGQGFIVTFPPTSEIGSNDISSEEAERDSSISIEELYKMDRGVIFDIKNTGSIPIPLNEESKMVILSRYIEHIDESGEEVNNNAFGGRSGFDGSWRFDSSYYDSSPEREIPDVLQPGESISIISDVSYPKSEADMGRGQEEHAEKKRYTVIGPYGSKATQICNGFSLNCMN